MWKLGTIWNLEKVNYALKTLIYEIFNKTFYRKKSK